MNKYVDGQALVTQNAIYLHPAVYFNFNLKSVMTSTPFLNTPDLTVAVVMSMRGDAVWAGGGAGGIWGHLSSKDTSIAANATQLGIQVTDGSMSTQRCLLGWTPDIPTVWIGTQTVKTRFLHLCTRRP